jgi:hypothetical protein
MPDPPSSRELAAFTAGARAARPLRIAASHTIGEALLPTWLTWRWNPTSRPDSSSRCR